MCESESVTNMRVLWVLVLVVGADSLSEDLFSEKERTCFAQEKMLYSGNDRCYRLLEVGPCNETAGEWLVLDEDSLPRLVAVCRPCRCCSTPLHVWWPGDETCHKKSDKTLCQNDNTILRDDPFGEGECVCINDPPHVRGPDSDACYPLHRRGPCSAMQVLVKSDRGTEKGRCVPDTCHHLNRKESGSGWFAASEVEGRGQCYRLGSQGPCSENVLFNVHPITLVPQCVTRILYIAQMFCRSGATDQAGQCVQEVNKPVADYVAGLVQASKKRRRRGVSVARGRGSSPIRQH